MLNASNKKGFQIVLLGVFLGIAVLAGCSSQAGKTSTLYQGIQYSQSEVVLRDNVRAICLYAGGLPALAIQLNGAQIPVCQLANGKRCDERALLQGSCASI
ncbi:MULTISPECIES: putative hemolysin [Photorhabdus]|uniref:putative hemolysin n=1 Tax=Photorhabdus TaxID=29487 RepID=UPI000DCCC14B|nr:MULTISPECIES: DUF333 domain-containing protein [Photorhabdus]MCT8341547.1 DUF333 domain-containing protein [Photorhabdus kleinii]RAX04319.1 hypothetical protein CKY03_00740 [Photorhabdus sp. S9-53]RAX04650.1 hypothetical protein CKY05_00740 [Photorhabdus sp. S10-54]RAX06268.1 hypothetical protein CKY04_00740 [Photorhabdus sp. S8-52]